MVTVAADAAPGDPRDSLAVREWASEWMAFSSFAVKPTTVASYESLLRSRILPAFGDLPLGDVDGLMVRRWISEMSEAGLSASRIQQAHRLLSQLFRSAVECRLSDLDPCAGVKLPRLKANETLFLNPREVERLADAVPRRYRALIYVLAYGGLRWGEAAALRRKRIDSDSARITVAESLADVNGILHFGETKTNRIRNVAIPAFLVEGLRAHLDTIQEDQEALVFTAPKGSPLRISNFRRRVWWPGLERAGLPHELRIHDLRHTCATMLISRGVHPKAIQHHLGHANIDITMNRYGHLLPDQFNDLAAQLDAAHSQTTV
jgi:integrase